MHTLTIREASAADAPQILTIYNDIIATSNAIYCEELQTRLYIETWISYKYEAGHPLFVAESEGRILGYCTYGQFRARPGYRFTVEHSVHVAEDGRGQGVGKALMGALIRRARHDGYHVMIGAVDAGNAGSLDFHRKLGFEVHPPIREIGYKFGKWLDLSFVTLALDAG